VVFTSLVLMIAVARADDTHDPKTDPGGNPALTWVAGTTTKVDYKICQAAANCIGSDCVAFTGKVVDKYGNVLANYQTLKVKNPLPYGNCVLNINFSCDPYGTVSCALVTIYNDANCNNDIGDYTVYAFNCCK
jgi:hypothetical protein